MNVGLYLYSEGPWANRSCCHRSIDPGHRHIVVLRRFRVGPPRQDSCRVS